MSTSCPECQGLMHKQTITLFYNEQEGINVQIQGVPAWVCSECGKRLISGKVANQVSELLGRLEEKGMLRQLQEDVARLQSDISQVRAASLELALA